VMEAE